jgi:hypothetical protein
MRICRGGFGISTMTKLPTVADPTAGNIPPPFARIVSQWFVVSTTSASRRPARFC